jgi:hypothetical protein
MMIVDAKDRSSFGSQSIHPGITTTIGKRRREASAKSSRNTYFPKFQKFSHGQFTVDLSGTEGTQCSLAIVIKTQRDKKILVPGKTERFVLSGAGGRGNVQEKSLVINSTD